MLGTLLGTFEYDPFERRIYKQSPGAPDGELPPGDFSWGIFTEGNSGFRSPVDSTVSPKTESDRESGSDGGRDVELQL